MKRPPSGWRDKPIEARSADEFAEIESLNCGRPVNQACGFDVGMSIDILRYTAGWATKLTGETLTPSQRGFFQAYTLREPVGVIGQITPFNAPLMLAVWKIASALAAGCAVVLKPAEQTPLTTLRFGALCLEAGLPEGAVNIVTGSGSGASAGAVLAAHPGVDKISFTGSAAVGKQILQAAGDNFKKVFLELGGKSPVLGAHQI